MAFSRRLLATCLSALAFAACSGPAPVSPSGLHSGSPSASAASQATTRPTPSSSGPPLANACRAADLIASGPSSGATGSVLVNVTVTNNGTSSCSLVGPPRAVRIRAVGGAALQIDYSADPRSGAAADSGTVAPAVTLDPGGTASAGFLWQNQCASRPRATRILVRVPGETAWLAFDGPDRAGLPRCDDDTLPATITGFAFDQ